MTTKRQAAATRKADVAEIIRALMDGPQTLLELTEVCDMKDVAITSWVRALREAGVVRIAERKPNKCWAYVLQSKPFGEPDAPNRHPPRDSDRRRAERRKAEQLPIGMRVAEALKAGHA